MQFYNLYTYIKFNQNSKNIFVMELTSTSPPEPSTIRTYCMSIFNELYILHMDFHVNNKMQKRKGIDLSNEK